MYLYSTFGKGRAKLILKMDSNNEINKLFNKV